MVHHYLVILHVMQTSSIFNKSDASNNNSIKKITNVYTSKVHDCSSVYDSGHAYKIDGTMIGYDFDYSYAEYNNTLNNTLFYAVQINGYVSLEGMECSDNATAWHYLKSHYNSILYL